MTWLGWLAIAFVHAGACQCLSRSSGQAAPGEFVYLSDVLCGICTYPLEYGKMLGLDATSYPLVAQGDARRSALDRRPEFRQGHRCTHGAIVVVLDGQYEVFEAEVGVQTGDEGTAYFIVTVDGEKRFESGEMKGGDAAKKCTCRWRGAKQMTLTAGSGVRANWADARLYRAAGVARPDTTDMAPFARVVTWDPQRKDGVRVNRLTRIPGRGCVSRVGNRAADRRHIRRANRARRRGLHRSGMAGNTAAHACGHRIRRADTPGPG